MHALELSAATVFAQETVWDSYVTTEAAVVDPVRILTITAKSYINELYVDDIKVGSLINDDLWQLPDEVNLSPYSRLVSILVTDTSFSCAGILASVTGDYLVTDASWKCSAQNFPGWYVLGFDDSSWSDAYVIGKNGDVTAPSECSILTEIPSISPNASWIWTASMANAPAYDPLVFCRGYLPTCNLDNPCLHGGTCNRNAPELCTCPPGITGKHCEIIYPFNAASLVGETVIMRCQRTKPHISWEFTRPGFTNSTSIVSDCKVLDNFNHLYAVDKTDGACNLVISNVGVRHAGTYTCEEPTINDDRTSAQLIVLNGVQQCWFSPSPVVYGQTVKITCQIPYSGNWAPAIRWTDLYGMAVTNATTDTTNSSVNSSILIPAYFPTVPSFTSTVFFDASSLPDVTDDIEADNTPTNIYNYATSEIDVVCPSGFTRTSQYHCYWLLFENLNWYGAQTRCQQLYPGTYLVVISDAPEQTDINNYLAGFGSIGNIWTSGYAADGCWNFAWQPLPGYFLQMTYTNWASTEPNCISGHEPSVALGVPGYQWFDFTDAGIHHCLCEYELSPK